MGNCAETVLLRPTSDEPELKVHHHQAEQQHDTSVTTPTLPSPIVCDVDGRTLTFSTSPSPAATTIVAAASEMKRLGHAQCHLAKVGCNGVDALANGHEGIDEGMNRLYGTIQKMGKATQWSNDLCQKTNHGATVSPNNETDI